MRNEEVIDKRRATAEVTFERYAVVFDCIV